MPEHTAPVVGHYYRHIYAGVEGMCDGIERNGRFKVHFVSGRIRWYSPSAFKDFTHDDCPTCDDEVEPEEVE